MSGIKTDDFEKSLGRLANLAKGTQLHHTASDSNPSNWAGTTNQDQDEWEDGIEENGTDYNGVKKALGIKVEKSKALTPAEVALVKGIDPRPMIGQKIAKGQRLTQAESWCLKGGSAVCDALSKGKEKPSAPGTPGEQDDAGSVPTTHAGDNNDEDIEGDAKKSLDGYVQSTPAMQDAMEVSSFLYEFTRGVGEALKGSEARIGKSLAAAMQPLYERIATLEKSFASQSADQGEYNKAFADAMLGVGQQLQGHSELAQQWASQPAHAPRSQFQVISGGQGGVQAVEKSFNGAQPGIAGAEMDPIQKSQTINIMSEMVEKGLLSHLEVIKAESTGNISPVVRQQVSNYMAKAIGQ